MRLVAILTGAFSVVLFSFIGCAVQGAEVKPESAVANSAPGIEFLDGMPTENVPHVCNFFETPDMNGNVGKCMTLRSYAIQYQKAKREAERDSEGEAVDHL